MSNNQYKYAEYAIGIRNRNQISIINDCPDCYGKISNDTYSNAYRFCDSIIDHVKKYKSVSGFKGPCRAPGLHFDFDGPQDTPLKDVQSFIKKLLSTVDFGIRVDDIDVSFSGNKGFHVIIRNDEINSLAPSEQVPAQVKQICTALAGEYHTFDQSVYDRTRLFRVTNSMHLKSGLFKIPLYPQELFDLSMHEIRNLAKHQRCITNINTIRQFLKRSKHGIA